MAATRTVDGDYGRYMETQPGDIRVESLGDRAELVEKTGLLRWREWRYADPDPTSWIEVTAKEAGPADHPPMTLVASTRLAMPSELSASVRSMATSAKPNAVAELVDPGHGRSR